MSNRQLAGGSRMDVLSLTLDGQYRTEGMMHFYEVLKRPIITEKSSQVMELNKYTFEVDRRANKAQVKEAVEKAFGVSVLDVNILTMPPKRGRWGRKSVQRQGVRKKAVVTVAPGERISFFE